MTRKVPTSHNNTDRSAAGTPDHGTEELLCRRTLEAQKRDWGPEHPDTLISLNNPEALLESKDTSEV